MTRPRKLNKLVEATAPPVNPVEALRRNLLYQMFRAVGDTDMADIVRAQVDKAKTGDTKAAKLIIDMVQAGGEQSGGGNVYMQQAIVRNGSRADDIRWQAAQLIATNGPLHTDSLAQYCDEKGYHVAEALDHEWFEREADGWHITAKARIEALEAKEEAAAP